MDPKNPNWQRLPGDPVAFFGLPDGFDARDLRRAYTRLIKVFKPEKAPAEFQRIRAAFEALDARFRPLGGGGRVIGERSPAAPEGNLPGPDSPPRRERDGGKRPRPGSDEPEFPSDEPLRRKVDALEILKSKGAEALLAELRADGDKDDVAWLQQALLEEELSGDLGTFSRVVVEGLLEVGTPDLLRSLLVNYCREPMSRAEAESLLGAVIRVTDSSSAGRGQLRLDPAAYWYMTEPIWLALLRCVPFSEFSELLAKCTSAVGEAGWRGRLVLEARLLRCAAFRADADWFAACRAEVDANIGDLPEHLAQGCDLAEWLLGYLDVRASFLERGPACFVWDEALTAIIEGEESRADRAFLRAMVFANECPQELLEAFPLREGIPSEVQRILDYWAEDLSERIGEPQPIDPEELELRVLEFRRRVSRRGARSFLGILWRLAVLGGQLLAVGLFFAPTFLSVRFAPETEWVKVASGLTTLALLLGGLDRMVGPGLRLARPLLRKVYLRVTRDLTLEFLRETRVHPWVLVSQLKERSHPRSLTESLEDDSGLQLYAMARRFV